MLEAILQYRGGDNLHSDNEVLRLFIGIKLSDKVRETLGNLKDELNEKLAGVRWVPIENLHITLKFLGNCEQGKVEAVAAVLDPLRKYLPCPVEIGGLGGFPSSGSAKIIWVGVDDPGDIIEEIYRSCEKGCGRLGFKKERRKYHPHVTIGRCRGRPVRLPWAGVKEGEEKIPLTVGGVTLFRSKLERTGAIYSVIHEVTV